MALGSGQDCGEGSRRGLVRRCRTAAGCAVCVQQQPKASQPYQRDGSSGSAVSHRRLGRPNGRETLMANATFLNTGRRLHFHAIAVRSLALLIVLVAISLAPCEALAQQAGSTPAGNAAEHRSVDPKLPTIFVVGDSTANNNANGALGWGDPFVGHFDQTKINVLNRARAGRSSRTFLTEGLWSKVLQELKAGDFVLIQFGHNDGGPVDKDRARGSLPGIGEEAQEFTMPNGKKEAVHTYGWYLRKFIADTKAKGATPVVLSLTVRNIW